MYPFEYDILWALREHKLTAGAVACDLNASSPHWAHRTAIGVSNQLRGLTARDLVTYDGDRPRIYRLTEWGEAVVSA